MCQGQGESPGASYRREFNDQVPSSALKFTSKKPREALHYPYPPYRRAQMTLHLSAFSGAIEQLSILVRELEILQQMLNHSKSRIRIDVQYLIRFRNQPEVAKSQTIEPVILEGDEAFDTCVRALTNILIMDGQHHRETYRAPGAVGVPKMVLDQIRRTNEIRKQLLDFVSLVPVEERRGIWLKQPGIIPSQALRVTTVLEDALTVVHYWDTGNYGTRFQIKDLVKEWQETLRKYHGYIPSLADTVDGSLESRLVRAIGDFATLDENEQVAIKRDVAPHIRARGRAGEKRYTKITSCPVVYDVDDPKPAIKGLPIFDPDKEKRTLVKSAKLIEKPYIESMKVYRYKEPHRKFCEVIKTKTSRHQLTAAPKQD